MRKELIVSVSTIVKDFALTLLPYSVSVLTSPPSMSIMKQIFASLSFSIQCTIKCDDKTSLLASDLFLIPLNASGVT